MGKKLRSVSSDVFRGNAYTTHAYVRRPRRVRDPIEAAATHLRHAEPEGFVEEIVAFLRKELVGFAYVTEDAIGLSERVRRLKISATGARRQLK